MDNGKTNVLGKMIMYSLSTDLKIDIRDFLSEAEDKGVPSEILPVHKNKTVEKEYLRIKEVRRSIAKAIEHCYGLNIRSNGGVAFIPIGFLPVWQSYEKMITSNKFEGVSIVSVDVANTTENKMVIIKALLEETKDEFKWEVYKLTGSKATGRNLKELLDDFLHYVTVRKLKVDATNNMYNRLNEEYKKMDTYGIFLNENLEYITSRLDEARNECREAYMDRLREVTW